MSDDIKAKNLLLDRVCHNCNNCHSLQGVEHFKSMDDKVFHEITGIHKEDVCVESNYLGTIFYCNVIDHTLPKELTCEHWELEKE